MRKLILSLISVSFVSFAAQEQVSLQSKESHLIHWSYEGETGPSYWSKISPEYFWCGLKNQSPIDISKKDTVYSKLPKLTFTYGKTTNPEIINNGHTVQVNILEKYTLNFKGKVYQLKQFHFHSPSEHTINGQYYPLEMHLVHKDENGNIAVIGVFFKEGKANSELEKVFSNAPKEEGNKILDGSININTLLPLNKAYFTYSGSLTTPPCTEGVRWIVLKQPITASKEQIEKFKSIMKHDNNRPIQPINSRDILESR